MKYLRWLLAVATGLYALMSAMPVAFAILHKLHLLALPDMVKSHGPLMDSLSWPQVAIWLAAVVLYLTAAVRLGLRKGKAFAVYIFAFICDVASWLLMQGPVYDATFPAGQKASDYTIMAVMAVIGALFFHVERKGGGRASLALDEVQDG